MVLSERTAGSSPGLSVLRCVGPTVAKSPTECEGWFTETRGNGRPPAPAAPRREPVPTRVQERLSDNLQKSKAAQTAHSLSPKETP